MKYVLLLLSLCIFAFGCGQEGDVQTLMTTAETSVIKNDTSSYDVPTQEEAYDMTIDILTAVTIDRLVAREALDPEDPDYETLMDAVYDEALVREAGFSLSFLRETLRPIVADVHGIVVEEEFDLGLTGEYIYLRFLHPNSSQEGLLLLFKESVEREEERIQTLHIVVLDQVSEQRTPQ